jgi:hypothetical protein
LRTKRIEGKSAEYCRNSGDKRKKNTEKENERNTTRGRVENLDLEQKEDG